MGRMRRDVVEVAAVEGRPTAAPDEEEREGDEK